MRGPKSAARARLVAVAEELRTGRHVERSSYTVRSYMTAWLAAPTGLSPKTLERYRQLAERQIYPHLGRHEMQKLRPAHIQEWHGELLKTLHPRTVGHAHRLAHKAYERARAGGLVHSNPLSAVKAPKVPDVEVEALTADQIPAVLVAIDGHALAPIVTVALGTGLRLGELLALQWGDVDLDGGTLRVERALEVTKDGLRFKSPKSRHGRRRVTFPATVADTLCQHRRQQLEWRLVLGMGRHPADALVFCSIDGKPLRTGNVSRDWARLVKARGLPRVRFHSLRHSHVSALIAAGLDVYSISRHIGHGSPALTLRVYGHLFTRKDAAAAAAIEAVLRG